MTAEEHVAQAGADSGRVHAFGSGDVTAWYKAEGQAIFLGDVVDHSSNASMSVGFARYDGGEENAWTLMYDEALVITSGAFTVRSQNDDTSVTATAGEVIYLRRGAEIVYRAERDTELVYVSYPHWFEATRESSYADQLSAFTPAATM